MAYHIPVAIAVKGAVAIGHWLAAHGTGAMAAKAGALVAKSIATQGFIATVTSVGAIAVGSSVVVGYVVWSQKAFKSLVKVLEAMGRGDTQTMVSESAKLALQIDVTAHLLADAVHDVLIEKLHCSLEKADQIAEYIKYFEKEIQRLMGTGSA